MEPITETTEAPAGPPAPEVVTTEKPLGLLVTAQEWEIIAGHAPAGKRDRAEWLLGLVTGVQELPY